MHIHMNNHTPCITMAVRQALVDMEAMFELRDVQPQVGKSLIYGYIHIYYLCLYCVRQQPYTIKIPRTTTRRHQKQVVEKPHAPALHLAPSTEPMLSFDKVQFRYTPQRPILQELSFEVRLYLYMYHI